jgi:hypothetical protein
MVGILGAFRRDGNRVPIQAFGVQNSKVQTLTGNNTTVATPLFGVTGSVYFFGIWGVVTTVLGANNTAAFYRLNDQTAQPAITLATGTALSAASVGSVIVKTGLAAAAVTLINSSAGRVNEPTTLETQLFSPFSVVQKTAGVATNIEFSYTTTDTPTSGVIQHFVGWTPLSADGNVTVL